MSDALYVVTWHDPAARETVSLRVREVADSPLGPMFVRLSGFQFGSSGLIVDPKEEALGRQFKDVRARHLNRMQIVSIDEISTENLHLVDTPPNVVVLRQP